MSTEDRRAPGATRIPFEGLVEVGGALGPSFEAQAVNVSEDGMLLRTAYLPEAGQPLTCRFDAGPGQSVLASGEVVWSHDADRGGEFGIRFTEMDQESVDALKRVCGVPGEDPAAATDPGMAPVHPGSKVRLHIEGLASPMRAKIKDAHPSEITVGSDLGFLQVGKQLELEDAQSGSKRPACIDRVEVAVDPGSHVPQLVVTLRYADVQGQVDAARGMPLAGGREAAGADARSGDDLAAVEEASAKMKGALAQKLAAVGPAVEQLAQRAKMAMVLLAQRRKERAEEASAPRRTTAPPPGGGLHTSGRRVVRGDSAAPPAEEGGLAHKLGMNKLGMNKRKAAVASAVMIAAVLGAIALKKSHHEAAPDANASAPADSALAAAADPSAALAAAPPAVPGAPATVAPPPPAAPPVDPGTAMGTTPSDEPLATNDDGDDAPRAHKRRIHVAPFGNGPVHHGNVLRLKMDGAIESIEGAQQPTGFAVKIPGRKSLEAAAPLAARDARIAGIKVSNDPSGAELTVAFKDGVPNYQVSARNDTLVIALAPAAALEKTADKSVADKTVADKDVTGGRSAKHAKHKHHAN